MQLQYLLQTSNKTPYRQVIKYSFSLQDIYMKMSRGQHVNLNTQGYASPQRIVMTISDCSIDMINSVIDWRSIILSTANHCGAQRYQLPLLGQIDEINFTTQTLPILNVIYGHSRYGFQIQIQTSLEKTKTQHSADEKSHASSFEKYQILSSNNYLLWNPRSTIYVWVTPILKIFISSTHEY